jgi:hypothetical protein
LSSHVGDEKQRPDLGPIGHENMAGDEAHDEAHNEAHDEAHDEGLPEIAVVPTTNSSILRRASNLGTQMSAGILKKGNLLPKLGASQAPPAFEKGNRVRVTKAGTKKGRLATVTDGNWSGSRRVMVLMDLGTGKARVKSYKPTELEHISGRQSMIAGGSKKGRLTEARAALTKISLYQEPWMLQYIALMRRCWSHDAKDRPSFAEISEELVSGLWALVG